MPELPEVETVKETLKKLVINKKIDKVIIRHNNIIAYPSVEDFSESIKGQTINDVKRRGKWLLFTLDDYTLVSHLRMEGKYFLKDHSTDLSKHEHVIFKFTDGSELRYHDTRKFGKMHLLKTDALENSEPLLELGLEPFDSKLNVAYLKEKLNKKRLPIKTCLLDQTIIVGIGNIYVDEILFLSKINPLTKPNELIDDDLNNIIINTKKVLKRAIEAGGTTIRSYTSSEGVSGKFQHELMIHNRKDEKCKVCGEKIQKIVVGGRGTYYCPNCQRQ